MEKIIITRPILGLCHMQVCAITTATDTEILQYCNKHNPSGTTNGWTTVIRDDPDKNLNPVQCKEYEKRMHYLISC
jgi:hypothetical protein